MNLHRLYMSCNEYICGKMSLLVSGMPFYSEWKISSISKNYHIFVEENEGNVREGKLDTQRQTLM